MCPTDRKLSFVMTACRYRRQRCGVSHLPVSTPMGATPLRVFITADSVISRKKRGNTDASRRGRSPGAGTVSEGEQGGHRGTGWNVTFGCSPPLSLGRGPWVSSARPTGERRRRQWHAATIDVANEGLETVRVHTIGCRLTNHYCVFNNLRVCNDGDVEINPLAVFVVNN